MSTQRIEFKYLLSGEQIKSLQRSFSVLGVRDKHSSSKSYTVRSLYFDSMDLASYEKKIEGVFFREKFRVRYLKNAVVLEKKCKAGLLSHKERYYQGDKKNKVLIDFTRALNSRTIHPILYITYERWAYTLGDCRITIDTSLKAQANHLDKEIIPGKGILEIKFINGQLPSLLYDLIKAHQLKRVAFSKYTNGVETIYGRDPRITHPESFDTNTFV